VATILATELFDMMLDINPKRPPELGSKALRVFIYKKEGWFDEQEETPNYHLAEGKGS
jgi:hypothetical protein